MKKFLFYAFIASISKYFSNFLNSPSGKLNLFELLTANLNLADRDGLFFIISSSDGIIALFMYFSNNSKSFLVSGKYLEGFDLFF